MSQKFQNKYSYEVLQGSVALVADTYAEINFNLGNKFDISIYRLFWIWDLTTMANLAADDKLQLQICRDLAAIGKASNNQIHYKHVLMSPKAIANITDSFIPTTVEKEFKKPLMIKNCQTLSVGAISPEAGFLEVWILIKKVDIAH